MPTLREIIKEESAKVRKAILGVNSKKTFSSKRLAESLDNLQTQANKVREIKKYPQFKKDLEIFWNESNTGFVDPLDPRFSEEFRKFKWPNVALQEDFSKLLLKAIENRNELFKLERKNYGGKAGDYLKKEMEALKQLQKNAHKEARV